MYVIACCQFGVLSCVRWQKVVGGEYDAVYKYLCSREYPDGMDKDSKRALRQKSASFAVEGGILMHKLGDKLCRLVMDVAERDRIVASLHADPIGGAHYGQTATIRKVTDRVWLCLKQTL